MPVQSIPHLIFNQPNPSLSKRHNFNLLSHQVEYVVFFNYTSINNSTRRLVIKTTWGGWISVHHNPPFTKKKKKSTFSYNVPLDIQFSKENEIQSIPQISKIHKSGNKTLVLSFTGFKPTKCYLLTLWVNEKINLRINKNLISCPTFHL